jgi:cobalt-zinc-cadmium efflux system outer membrane protein
MTARLGGLVLAAVLAGCTSAPKDAGFSDIAATVETRSGAAPQWVGETVSEDEARRTVADLLSRPLTDETAVEIAFLNNRALRAELYGLKAARGDLIDAGRPPNPFVSGVLLDVKGEPVTNYAASVGFELLDFLFLPGKIDAANAEFDAAQAETGAALIDIVADVRAAYYEVLAARQMAGLYAQAQKASEASAAAAEALYAAGNIPKIDLDRERLLAAQLRIEARRAEAAYKAERETLNRVLGLQGGAAASWTLKGRLRPPPKTGLGLESAESAASDASFRLAAADARLLAEGERMGLKTVQSFIGDLEVEFERERDEGEIENGGGVGLTLPIFNQGAGKREAASARLTAMMENRIAEEVAVRAAARGAAETLRAAWEAAVFQRETVLPLAAQILHGTQRDYNAMQTGVFGLLDAKRAQLDAGRDYVTALRDYWVARTRYERILAGGSALPASLEIRTAAAPAGRNAGGH